MRERKNERNTYINNERKKDTPKTNKDIKKYINKERKNERTDGRTK